MARLQQDAALFSGFTSRLEALDEELVSLCPPISTHRHASAPKVEDFEEDTQTAEGHCTRKCACIFLALKLCKCVQAPTNGKSRESDQRAKGIVI
jgi:hypothetical protein